MHGRGAISEYDLGLPVPIASLEERRRGVPPEVWARLEEAKRRVTAILGPRVRELRLFGSYARGQADEDSDVDVLVVVDRLEPGDHARLVDAVHGASGDDIILAPLILTTERLEALRRREMILAEDLDREGIPL